MLNNQFRTNPLSNNLRERLHSLLQYAYGEVKRIVRNSIGEVNGSAAPELVICPSALWTCVFHLTSPWPASHHPRIVDSAEAGHLPEEAARVADSRVYELIGDIVFSVINAVDIADIERAFNRPVSKFTDADLADLHYLICNPYVPFMIAAEDDGDTQLTIADVVDRAYDEASAIDIIAREDIVLRRGEVKKLCLKFRSSFDRNLCALILPRSGQGSKAGLSLVNTAGLIDADYRGEWIANVVMRDYDGLAQEELVVEKGKAVAQILVLPHASAQAITFCTDAALLDVSTRGEGGFGSSDNAKQK